MASEALVVQESLRQTPEWSVPRPLRELDIRRRVDLGGVLIDQVDLSSAVDRIRGFLGSERHNQIVTVNLDFVAISRRDEYFRETLNDADLAVADGMPLVWVSQLGGSPVPERITGNDLVDECCRVAVETKSSIFLLGAGPGIADIAAKRLGDRFPGLRVSGVYAPPFGPLTDAENEKILRFINEARPDFLFVALGAPQQDVWIKANRDRLDVPVCMGVGGTFDLLAGVLLRAPVWMQRAGLEWLFRLGQEPSRLWRRYIVDDLPVLGWLIGRSLAPSRPRPNLKLGIARRSR
jgi:N-acetylglucosaminyldiphosphoundecaprenol N-acetyl-beta-D-mannosaminyltransferase